jgi:response regulator NasT
MPRNKSDDTPTKLLIVDDEPFVRMDLRDLLTNAGYEIVGEAVNGREAVTLARSARPDLVVMDIKMEEERDGITAARLIDAEDLAPVLLLTGHTDPERVQGATEAGVIGYLVKPFREEDLVPAIEVALARADNLRTLRKEVGSLKDQIETRKLVERAKGILMDQQGLREAEAYRRMQKLSMNTRKTMREIAEAILLTHEVEQDAPGGH